MSTEDEGIIMEAIDILKQSGSVEYASNIAKDMIKDAWMNLENDLPSDCELAVKAKGQLKDLSMYLVDREL